MCIAWANSRMNHDDELIQTSLLFSCAYLSYWFAESGSLKAVLPDGASGVLRTRTVRTGEAS